MQKLKEKWDKHPIVWLISLCLAFFVAGIGVGNYFDTLLAEINGKQILSDIEVEKLSRSNVIGPNEIIVNKSTLASLKNRPEACPQKICSKDSSIETRDCITEKQPSLITEKFNAYSREKNEKTFKDKYFSRWLCSPGWIVKIYNEPSINADGYWEFSAFWNNPEEKYENSFVGITLSYKNSAKNISEGDIITITGRLSRASNSSISLTEVSFNK